MWSCKLKNDINLAVSLFSAAARTRYRCRNYATSTATPAAAASALDSPFKPIFNLGDVRANAADIIENMKHRNCPASIDAVPRVVEMHGKVQTLRKLVNELGHERGVVARKVGLLAAANKRKRNDREVSSGNEALEQAEELRTLVQSGRDLKLKLTDAERELEELEERMTDEVSYFPNMTHPDVPVGDEQQARLIGYESGLDTPYQALSPNNTELKTIPTSPPVAHMDILRSLDCVDFEAASFASGANMYYLKNEAALLEVALIHYGISRAVARGWTPIITPDIVRSQLVRGCGFQPRTGDTASQNYGILDQASDDIASSTRYLSATAEIPLAGLLCHQTHNENDFPKKYVAFGRAYRAEADSGDGLYRVHQFSKVELFAACKPEQSPSLFEEIREIQEDILRGLNLQYRVLDMPTEELGASAYRKYDMEAWMPGRGKWGEVSSASHCTDYQARRLGIRYRPNKNPNASSRLPALPVHAHTLNGTACAIPRLIVAIVEQRQKINADGKVGFEIPEVLQPWMMGVNHVIWPHANKPSRKNGNAS